MPVGDGPRRLVMATGPTISKPSSTGHAEPARVAEAVVLLTVAKLTAGTTAALDVLLDPA